MTSIKKAFRGLGRKGIYQQLVETSGCRVICPRPVGELLNLQIEFTGELIQMPSINDRRPFLAGGRIIEDWRKDVVARFQAMTFLYTQAVMALGILPPTFHGTHVHVHVILGHRKGRWDCHNTTKAVCDWLQVTKEPTKKPWRGVGIINDDARAQAWTTKASWFDLPQDRTTIVITRLALLTPDIRTFVSNLLSPA
jgi:hypothetical protein